MWTPPPPVVHLMSTWCHSRGKLGFPGLTRFSPLFHFHVLYWAQTKQQKQGRLGNEAVFTVALCASFLHAALAYHQPTNHHAYTPCSIQILGYARKLDNGWSFSPSAVSLLKQFQSRFPRLLEYICANPGEDKYYEEDLFPDTEGWVLGILEVLVWLTCLELWSTWVALLQQWPSLSLDIVSCVSLYAGLILYISSKVTTPQDAHKVIAAVYHGSNTSEFSAIRRWNLC